ncbi:MAG: hypothetical protein U0414_11265 [Polyangiaceae bacterium]
MSDDIEAFAAAAARIDAVGGERSPRPRDYAAAELHWARVLRQEAIALAGDSLERYVRAYLAAVAVPTQADMPALAAQAAVLPAAGQTVDRVPVHAAPGAASPVVFSRMAATPVETEPPAHLRATAVLPGAAQEGVAPAPLASQPLPRLTTMAEPPSGRPVATPFESRAGHTAASAQRMTTVADPRGAQPAATPFVLANAAVSPSYGPVAVEPQSGLTTAPGKVSLETLPFHRASSPTSGAKPMRVDLGMMPLERYADLSFALASGEPRELVLRRFVLTEDVWQAVAAAWGEKIRSDPSLKASFDRYIAERRRRGL